MLQFWQGSASIVWESHSALGVKGNVRHPASLPCTANHTSFIFPSMKMELCRYVKHCSQSSISRKPSKVASLSITPLQLQIDDTADDVPVAVEGSPSDGLLSVTLQSCLKQLKQKDDMIRNLNRKLENSRKLSDVYKKKASNRVEVLNTSNHTEEFEPELDNAIIKAVNDVLSQDKRFQRYGHSRKAQLIAKAVFSPHLFQGNALPFIIQSAKKWLQTKHFLPLEGFKSHGSGRWIVQLQGN